MEGGARRPLSLPYGEDGVGRELRGVAQSGDRKVIGHRAAHGDKIGRDRQHSEPLLEPSSDERGRRVDPGHHTRAPARCHDGDQRVVERCHPVVVSWRQTERDGQVRGTDVDRVDPWNREDGSRFLIASAVSIIGITATCSFECDR